MTYEMAKNLARSRIFPKNDTVVIYDDSDAVLVDMYRPKFKVYELGEKIKLVDVSNKKKFAQLCRDY